MSLTSTFSQPGVSFQKRCSRRWSKQVVLAALRVAHALIVADEEAAKARRLANGKAEAADNGPRCLGVDRGGGIARGDGDGEDVAYVNGYNTASLAEHDVRCLQSHAGLENDLDGSCLTPG